MEYEVSPWQPPRNADDAAKFTPMSQPIVIYDNTGKIYLRDITGRKKKRTVIRRVVFDGVTKIEHKLSLNVEADPTQSKKGAKKVNGATNNQNEITMDLYMSNVYTSKNIYYSVTNKDKSESDIDPDEEELAKSNLTPSGDRSGDLFNYLNNLKRARRKVKVITPYVTYSNMLLSEINIIQDDTVYNGWYGSLAFKESVEQQGGGGQSSYTKANSEEYGGRIASLLVGLIGPNAGQ